LTVGAIDWTSGVKQIRFSNDGTWNQATWESYSTSKSWQLTSGEGTKTVYCQIQDYAGLTTTISASINLNSAQPTPTAFPTVSPTPIVPEFTGEITLLLLAMITAVALVAYKRKSSICT
jgi:hypothetical protein